MKSSGGIAVGAPRPCRPSFIPSVSTPLTRLVLRPPTLSRTRTSATTRSGAAADAAHTFAAEPDDPSVSAASLSEEALLNELERREGFRRERALQKENAKSARQAYQFIACASSLLMAGLASTAGYIKFVFTKPKGSPFPWTEFAAFMFFVTCGTACMEMYARWAHRVWWHELPSGWALHKSHHAPRKGPFEANDIYAVANALPAFLLCYIGFFRSGLLGSLLFGLGLGITLFGMAYMFVHDGLVHKRFPVGPLATVPFMKKVAAAHMIHHGNKFGGKPYGMFLGPQEISHIPEAVEEMERLAFIL